MHSDYSWLVLLMLGYRGIGGLHTTESSISLTHPRASGRTTATLQRSVTRILFGARGGGSGLYAFCVVTSMLVKLLCRRDERRGRGDRMQEPSSQEIIHFWQWSVNFFLRPCIPLDLFGDLVCLRWSRGRAQKLREVLAAAVARLLPRQLLVSNNFPPFQVAQQEGLRTG